MIITYVQDLGLFVANAIYDERFIPKQAGFRWDPAAKKWYTADVAKAKRLQPYCDQAALRALGVLAAKQEASVEASHAEVADIDVPCPPGLAFRPFQRAAVAYALQRKTVLVADEMGLGKTIEAIGVANCQPDLRRILIICPASVRLNWEREWKRWNTSGARPIIVTDTWWHGIAGNGVMEAKSIAVIVSYQGVRKWKAKIDQIVWDLLIMDEAHALKNPGTKQSRVILGYQRADHPEHIKPIQALRTIAMTGTPIVNRPAELWPLLHALDRSGLGADRQDYFRRYVGDPYLLGNLNGKSYSQAMIEARNSAMAELHIRLRGSIMIRRLKKDVLKELPAKTRQLVLIDPAAFADVLRAEREAIAAKAKELAALRHENAVQKLNTWRGAALTEISRIRHETAVKKIPAVVEHLYDLFDNFSKVVVFCHHHDVIDGIKEALPPPGWVVLDGREQPAARQNAVDRFQTDPTVRLFIGSIRAAGLGITLTAANVVCFAELDWTPAAMVQAEDRLHRIGQEDKVLVQHLVIDGSIDQRMSEILISKAEMIDRILDGKVPEEFNRSVLEGVLA